MRVGGGLTVSDLSSVPLQGGDFRVHSDVLLCVVAVPDLWSIVLLVVFLELLEQVVPDLAAGIIVERGIAKGQMDARHECFVKLTNSVRSKEQNALEVV